MRAVSEPPAPESAQGASPAASSGTRGRVGWLMLLALAIVETVAHAVTRSRVASDEDWGRATARVRRELMDGDIVRAAPDWVDAHVRVGIGDAMTFEMAAPSDLAPFERLWVISTRGHRSPYAPRAAAALTEGFGRVRVERWDLGASPVRFHFLRDLRRAQASYVAGGVERPCGWRSTGEPFGGGLGAGALTPAERFVCDGAPGWVWIGPTVVEDLDLEPRACVWQHPTGDEPVRLRYDEVPLGERIVLYTGLYYEDERMRELGPYTVRVLVNEREVGRVEHRDGDGWKRVEMMTRTREQAAARPDERGRVTFETTSPRPDRRRACWTATVRAGPDRGVDAPLPPRPRPASLTEPR